MAVIIDGKKISQEIKDELKQKVAELKEQGKTILIASHSSEDIELLCDSVCEMEKGVLTAIK